MAKWENDPIVSDGPHKWESDPIAPEGTWAQEASHALTRGSFRGGSSLPGTLASLMEAGANMPSPFQPGSGIPGAPTRAEHGQTVRSLRRTAKNIHRAASAPSLQPKKGGVGGFVLNTMLESLPVLAASTGATIVAGPAGGFGVGAMTMGEDVYQNAINRGADPDTANAERLIAGLIGGAVEMLQADEVLKLGKGSVQAVIKAARDRAWKKAGAEAGKLTAEQLAGAASEGLEEALQEATQIGVAAMHGEKIATVENLKRVGMAGVGGATAGGLMKAGRTLLSGGGVVEPGTPRTAEQASLRQRAEEILAEEDAVVEPRPADAPAYEDDPAPAAVPLTMEELGREVRGDAGELPIAGVQERPQIQTSVDDSTQAAPAGGGDEYKMSARQADVDAGRERRGLEAVEPQDSIPWAESSRLAQEQGIKDKALAIATTVNAEPRALTHVETAGMVDKAIELDTQYEQLTAQMTEANSKGDTGAVKVLSTAINQNQAEYDTLTRAIYASGSEKGRDLASQKLAKGRDFRLVAVKARATAAKGAPLTADEEAKLDTAVKSLEEVTKAAAPVERKAAEEEAAETLGLAPESGELVEVTKKADGVRKELTRRRANRILRSKKGLRRYIDMTEADKDAELQQFLADAGEEPSDADLLAIAMNIASRKGANNLGDVAARMQQYFPNLGQDQLAHSIAMATQRGPRTTNPLLKVLYEIRQEGRTNDQLQVAIQDLIYYTENGEVPDKMIRTVRNPTEAIAALRQIKAFYRQQLENSEPARKKKLEEQVAILERRIEARDFLPRAKPAPLPMSEELRQLETKRNSLRADLAAMRKPGARRYSLMSEADKDAELQQLLGRDMDAANIAKIAENIASREGVNTVEDVAQAMWPLTQLERSAIVDAVNTATTRRVRTTNAMVEKLQTIDAEFGTIGNLRERIGEILRYLNNGQVPAKATRVIKNQTEAVRELKAIRDMLHKELRNSEPVLKQRLAERLAYLDTRLKNNDFAPRPKTAVKHTPELDRMRYAVARAQHTVRQRIAALRPTTPWDAVMAPFRVIQSLKSAFDFSAVRRQGGWMVLTHPVRSLRRVPEMFQAAWSEEKTFRIMEKKIHGHPKAARYHAAGGELTDPGMGMFTDREEMFRSDLANRIPILGRGVKGSNRAYATFLNLVRMDAFDAMTDAFLADGGVATIVEEKAIANFINVTTGRGATGSMKAAADAANGLFWSPRYVISRFQLLFGQPLYRGSARTRKLIAKEYARYLAGLVVVYTLGKLAGGVLEDDPRSSDFGKIRFGDTRLDPLSGLAQTVVFTSRVVTGQTKRASGAIVATRGEGIPYGGDDTADVIARFLRTKLAPAPAMFADVVAGRNVVGEPTTGWSVAKGVAIPLSMSDIYGTMVEQGVPAGMALSILGLFGEGVQTYQAREKRRTDRRMDRRYVRRRAD